MTLPARISQPGSAALPYRPQPVAKPAAAPPKPAQSGRAGRRCYGCGKRLAGNTRAHYHGNACRVRASRRKRKLADALCVSAFGWQPGQGEALIARYGLRRIEAALHLARWFWQADQQRWQQHESASRTGGGTSAN